MDELGLDIDEEYDLNEIESRLYSQVFHGSAEDETDTNVFDASVDINTSINSKRQSYRYFGNRFPSDARSSVHITIDNSNQAPTTCSSVHDNNLTILTESNVDFIKFSNGYENIVNHYTIPVIISTDRVQNLWNAENLNYTNFGNLKACNVKDLSLYNFDAHILTRKQKNQIRNKKKKERQKLRQFNKILCQEKNKKIIFISDESEDECILIKDNSTMFSKEITNEKIEREPVDSDDDIIYIPPPPVQIINIDEEENIKEAPKLQSQEEYQGEPSNNNSFVKNVCSNEIQDVSNVESTSNDFLENAVTENALTRFNFALHGSDFTNNSEFSRPNNLVDSCETESSCSTNDPNRDFNNSTKSIVFDEVEFPREDIFSDKNLDSFGSFITPRRNNKNLEDSISPATNKNDNISVDSDSSTSSTESDYETSENKTLNKNLPMLSPMVTSQALSKINVTPKLNKKKLNVTSIPAKKTVTKRKSTGKDCLETQLNNKSSKKKKKVNKKLEAMESSIEENEIRDIENSEEEDKEVDNLIKKKKRRKSHPLSEKLNEKQIKDIPESAVANHNLSDPNVGTCYDTVGEQEQVRKKKRKKKKTKKSIDINEDKTEDNLCISEEISNNSKDTKATEVEKEILSSFITNMGDNENVQTIMNKKADDKLDMTDDPSDIILYNEPIEEVNEANNFHKDSGKEDDVIVIDQIEHNASTEVIVLDDMSDSSDIEFIEPVNFDSVELSNLELGNTTIADTSIDICNLNLNDRSLDYFNSFDVISIQNKQSDDPQKWLISHKDRNNYLVVGKKGPRCSRCRHFGHIGARCPDKPYPPCCTLCSATNHQEPRCPNKVCRQCGNPGDYSTSYCYLCFKYRHVKCNLCNVPGHISKTCPDLWRRYHLTTEAGPIVMPNQQVMRPRNQQWCSGCAQQGHLEHECNDTYYHREFPPTRPDIVTYIDVLNETNIPRDISYIPDSVPKPPPNSIPLYSFPIMNNLLTINTNPLSQFGRTVAPNSVNSNIIIQVPNSCVQQNVLTSSLIDQMRSNFQNPNINPFSTNIIQQMSHNFQSPVLPVEEKTENFTEPSKYDMRKIQELFMLMPHATVKNFVRKQIEELDTKIVNYNPKILRYKLFKYDRISENMNEKIKRDRCFWFRVLNMFVFGLHNLNDGKIHMRFIRNFLASRKANEFDESRRRSLFNSYSYIFGVERHTNINYYRLIKLLVDRCNEGKVVKPL